MDFTKLEGLIKGLAPSDWHGFHQDVTGKRSPLLSVEKVDCGLNLAKQKTWVKARYIDNTGTHTLMGKTKVSEPGTQGGADEITLDDQAEEHDDVVLGLQFEIFKLRANVVLAYKFGEGERYEFSGRLPVEKVIGL